MNESEEGALAVLMRPEGNLCWSMPKVGRETSFSVFHGGEEVYSFPSV